MVGGLPTAGGSAAIQSGQSTVRQDSASDSASGLAPEARFPSDGTEILSDALPDPILVGQQYAAGGSSGRPPRRGSGPPETPVGRFLSGVYEGKVRTLAELEPNHKLVTQIRAPDWRPNQRDIDKIEEELIRVRQRAPGAIDTQASGIGIGPFARESFMLGLESATLRSRNAQKLLGLAPSMGATHAVPEILGPRPAISR